VAVIDVICVASTTSGLACGLGKVAPDQLSNSQPEAGTGVSVTLFLLADWFTEPLAADGRIVTLIFREPVELSVTKVAVIAVICVASTTSGLACGLGKVAPDQLSNSQPEAGTGVNVTLLPLADWLTEPLADDGRIVTLTVGEPELCWTKLAVIDLICVASTTSGLACGSDTVAPDQLSNSHPAAGVGVSVTLLPLADCGTEPLAADGRIVTLILGEPVELSATKVAVIDVICVASTTSGLACGSGTVAPDQLSNSQPVAGIGVSVTLLPLAVCSTVPLAADGRTVTATVGVFPPPGGTTGGHPPMDNATKGTIQRSRERPIRR